MNRTTALLGAIIGAMTLSGAAIARPHIVFHGHRLHFQNHPFKTPEGIEVPFREMGDLVGARTGRTPDGHRVFIDYHGRHLEYDKGHFAYWLDGRRFPLAMHNQDRNGIMFVPMQVYRAVTHGEATVVDDNQEID